MHYELIIVGAGAAGLMAAAQASSGGVSVALLEHNERAGKKLNITGKGRCNLTNNCDVPTLMANIPTNGRFLYSAFSRFNSQDTMAFFEALGVPLKTERGNRVFPVSDNAADITNALYKLCIKNGVKHIHTNVTGLLIENGEIIGVNTTSGELHASSVILATGGLSYPVTGSDGSGHKMAQEAGHTIVPPKASLVPLTASGKDCRDMMGLSLKNSAIKLTNKKTGKCVYKDFGELLFTHFGLSGPVVLSASSHLRDMESGLYSFIIDLKPALTEEQLEARLLREFAENTNKDLRNLLRSLLPAKMIGTFIKRTGIQGEKKAHQISKEERRAIIALLKGFVIEIEGFRPISEAIITSGGVSVKEINPSTMESKLVKGLYFAGEIIDADAHTGGFNLQIAFSTAAAAARGKVQEVRGKNT
ncbi:MAG: NAD(P)/FAD-dependent oxidoreductase [Oscillospiraceae bacterium]|jgi:predicted Rossmann fold flavoprotein|nr:NAD(P)/FAD-dependent oxidoreductase [Oscillospiraceae bacterium]